MNATVATSTSVKCQKITTLVATLLLVLYIVAIVCHELVYSDLPRGAGVERIEALLFLSDLI